MLAGGKRETTLAQHESNPPGYKGAAGSAPSPGQSLTASQPRPGVTADVTDEDLVVQAAGGKAEAFETLVARYQDRVFNTLSRMSSSAEEAEDLAQETFLKAYRALNSFRQGSTFYTWLFRIAVNTAFSRRRQDGRRRSHEGLSLDSPGGKGEDGEKNLKEVVADPSASDPAEQMEKELIRKRVREGLEQIEPDYRSILLLRDIEGMDYDGIAETLSISRAAVKSRLHRARLEMARILKDLRPPTATAVADE
jgi:RNA polymerase sigma-70 factor (ECF subfamily)